MRVHASNFRTVGFTEEVTLDGPRGARARARPGPDRRPRFGRPGTPARRPRRGARGRARRRARASRPAPTSCASPRTSCSAGRRPASSRARRRRSQRMRAHPLARALRIDKLSLAALEATLRLHRDPERAAREHPGAPDAGRAAGGARRARAAAARRHRGRSTSAAAACASCPRTGRAGGGALPLLELDGPAVAVTAPAVAADELHARLRAGDPPIVARVRDEARRCSTRARSPRSRSTSSCAGVLAALA